MTKKFASISKPTVLVSAPRHQELLDLELIR